MTYLTILDYADASPQATFRLRIAAALAERSHSAAAAAGGRRGGLLPPDTWQALIDHHHEAAVARSGETPPHSFTAALEPK